MVKRGGRYLTSAQKKGRRMRARGRDYRGGFTREQIKNDEHKKRTCRVRECTNRFFPEDGETECKSCRSDD